MSSLILVPNSTAVKKAMALTSFCNRSQVSTLNVFEVVVLFDGVDGCTGNKFHSAEICSSLAALVRSMP